MAEPEVDILERLADLHHQATTEKSHYYVGVCVREAMTEIMRLRETITYMNYKKKK
jgi:hypothetical protein